MPDIISRIKVQAEGADAAAREIRKLKEAYADVSAAARGLSPNTGGADPFTAATSPPGGGIIGGQRSPGEVFDNQRRNDEWRQGAEDRLRNNQNYPTRTGGAPTAYAGGAGLPGMVNRGIDTAQALGQGQFGSVAGGAMQGIASLVGGPAGIAALVVGGLALGTQKLADRAMERQNRLWGGGVTQRLGTDYTDLMHLEALWGTSGIPLDQIYAFTGAASQAGVSGTGRGFRTGSSNALEAMVNLGLDVSTTAGLLGALSRGGADMGLAGYGMYGAMKGAFGPAGVGRGVTALTQMVEGMESRGIQLSPAAFQNSVSMMTGLSVEGGLSVDAAGGLTNRLVTRSAQAAGLGSPEDVMAFAAMRGQGMSITDTMIAMESQPGTVTSAVYAQLRQRFAGNEDALNMALQKWTGGTMSETVALRKTLDAGGTYEDYVVAWQNKVQNESGEWVTTDERRSIQKAFQGQLLFGMEEAALTEIVGKFGEKLVEAMRGNADSAGTFGLGDRLGTFRADAVEQAIIAADSVVIANNVLTDDIETGGGLSGRYKNIGRGLGLDISGAVNRFTQGWTESQMIGGVGTIGGGEGAVYGNYRELTGIAAQELLRSAVAGASNRRNRGAVRALGLDYDIAQNPQTFANIETAEQSLALLQKIVDELTAIQPIYTDGE